VTLRIDIVTLFPEFVRAGFEHSILKRAIAADLVKIEAHDLRDWTHDKRRSVDDSPYGGGAGMVLKPEPLFEAVDALKTEKSRIILMTPQGERFDQNAAKRLAALDGQIILLCGHYEGFDERVREHLVDEEISIGDYVLTGGELAALVVTDAIARLLPGVLGNGESSQNETFEDGLLEYPQYTRPATYRGWSVPDVLVSGHHAEVAKWRHQEQVNRTKKRRPDLPGAVNSE
jgi:tRNA (guanine37-N1)-methyltransferase